MDPYLEDPARWSGVHSRLINTISDELADRVSPHFFVDIESRVHILAPDEIMLRAIVPDVYVVQGAESQQSAASADAITAPTVIEPLYEQEIRERYLVIRDRSSREVVTTLEVLSPFNKASSTSGREAFLSKRQAVMQAATHWIEIDLLRAGERPAELAGQSDYYALLRRGVAQAPYEVWFFDLRDRLPTIAVPLRGEFADVPLDLQAMLEHVYARGHYAESLDYAQPVPAPRLTPATAAWAAAQVQAWQGSQASS
jgi:hypothetical protein